RMAPSAVTSSAARPHWVRQTFLTRDAIALVTVDPPSDQAAIVRSLEGGPLAYGAVLGFRQEQRADNDRHQGDDDRVAQSVVDVARHRHQRERDGRQEAAEPAVADVIRQR